MGDLIFQRPELVRGLQVLELAGGLGLPSFVAARYAGAAFVCCSDYMEEAVDCMTASAAHLGLSNVSCRVLDWNELPSGLAPDVLLLSDINYDPATFEILYGVLEGFLLRGVTILLSTPQRLMAKPFIERLLPFCREQVEVNVENVAVSLLVLSV
jgi:predicted nicotinamide N-methyase